LDTRKPNIAIVGPGVMGETMVTALLRQGVVEAGHIWMAGPRQERLDELVGKYGIHTNTHNAEAAGGADVVVLCVKPQRLRRVLSGLRDQLKPDALVISMVAGAAIQTISEGLNHSLVIRCMPNTPAQIGLGITAWATSPQVQETDLELARSILTGLGQEILVEEESYLDMATAVSGSGPSYVFLFMEAMIDAGVHLGLPRRIAEQMVVQTLRGSVDYFSTRKVHPAVLRNEVTSPGGTSAEALYYLDKAGVRTAISRAIWAAYERSQELGKDQNSKKTIE
jgi:pyrroline-5-carboxylate reductase